MAHSSLLPTTLPAAAQLNDEWANSLLPGGGIEGVRQRLVENAAAERESMMRERTADAFTAAGKGGSPPRGPSTGGSLAGLPKLNPSLAACPAGR